MLTPISTSVPKHTPHHLKPHLHSTRNDDEVVSSRKSSLVVSAISGDHVSPSPFTTPLLFGLLITVVTLLLWMVPYGRLTELTTAMIFLVVLNFDRVIRGKEE